MATSTRRPGEQHVFVAPSPGRKVVGVLIVLGLAGLVWSLLRLREAVSTPLVALAVVCGLVMVGGWTYLKAKIPQRITVDRAIIEVRRDGHVHRYDLEDPAVDIRVRDGEIAFAHYMDNWVLVSARDVDWKVFSDIVMHYQNNADHNAERRDERFSR
ncbi:MAG: hypothetical protein JWR20_1868 [Marmoricola sp.]|nr:hypothetical protein [Marmoricola sp.]